MAWNSVESIVGTFSATHLRLNRCGTSKIGIGRLYNRRLPGRNRQPRGPDQPARTTGSDRCSVRPMAPCGAAARPPPGAARAGRGARAAPTPPRDRRGGAPGSGNGGTATCGPRRRRAAPDASWPFRYWSICWVLRCMGLHFLFRGWTAPTRAAAPVSELRMALAFFEDFATTVRVIPSARASAAWCTRRLSTGSGLAGLCARQPRGDGVDEQQQPAVPGVADGAVPLHLCQLHAALRPACVAGRDERCSACCS